MSAFRLPVVRHLKSMVLGPERDFRSPANCLDLARLRVFVSRPSVRQAAPERLLELLSEEIQGVTAAKIVDDVLTVNTRDETSEYCFQTTLPPR